MRSPARSIHLREYLKRAITEGPVRTTAPATTASASSTSGRAAGGPVAAHTAPTRGQARRTLASLSTVLWSSDDFLYTLVAIGLGCCAEDPEDRMRLRVARARLAILQRILRRTTGAMTVSVLPHRSQALYAVKPSDTGSCFALLFVCRIAGEHGRPLCPRPSDQ